MGKIQVSSCEIEGLLVITPQVFEDMRGYFLETYHKKDYEEAGITADFVQDNQSKSVRGVLRGLHYQREFPQAKLMRVLKGEIFDVAVDIREDSKTYGKWFGLVLSEENKKQLFIPEGFAHGFLVLSEVAEIAYKCSDFYHPNDEGGILWSDEEIGITWPIPEGLEVMLSEKDRQWKGLSETITKK